MAAPVNVLIMIHGMRIEAKADTQTNSLITRRYQSFWQSLCAVEKRLPERFKEPYIGVEWGQEIQGVEIRPDQQLTKAQQFVNQQVSYKSVQADEHNPNNTL